MSEKLSGATIIAKKLKSLGCEVVFGLVGIPITEVTIIKIMLYKMAVRPMISYASPVWLNPSYVSSCSVEEIRRFERTILRNCTGLYFNREANKHYNSSKIYTDSNTRRFDVFAMNLAIRFYEKCELSDQLEIKEIVRNSDVNQQRKRAPVLFHLYQNDQINEDGRFLIFNRGRDGSIRYIINQ